MWKAIEPFGFVQTHGAFLGQDVYDSGAKGRVRESMRIQARAGSDKDGAQQEIWDEGWP